MAYATMRSTAMHAPARQLPFSAGHCPPGVSRLDAHLNHELDFDVICDLEAFLQLEADWTKLFREHGQSQQMFQTFDWVAAWSRDYLGPVNAAAQSTLHIVTARQAGELVLVMPLIRTCVHGQCRIEWLGHPVSQYGDVLVNLHADAYDLVAAALTFVPIPQEAMLWFFVKCEVTV